MPWNEKTNIVMQQLVKVRCQSIKNLHIWIGINDMRREGKWVAYDGSKLTYTNWEIDEPNNQQNEDCGMLAKHSGRWHDFSCGKKEPFICQKKAGKCFAPFCALVYLVE